MTKLTEMEDLARIAFQRESEPQSLKISDLTKSIDFDAMDGKEQKNKLREDIEELNFKRKKFKKQLESLALNAATQDADVEVLK